MAKNLKLNIKNAQLAEALKINQLKKKPIKAKAPPAEDAPASAAIKSEKPVETASTTTTPVAARLEPASNLPRPATDEGVKATSTPPPAESRPTPKGAVPIQKTSLTETEDKESSVKKPLKPISFEEENAPKKATGFKDFKDTSVKKKPEPYRKSFDSRDRHGLRTSEDESWRKKRAPKLKAVVQPEEIIRPKKLAIRLPITVKDLAAEMKLKAAQLISKLFMQGVILTLNDILDDETTVQLLGHEFDCEISIDTTEEDRLKITGKSIKEEVALDNPENLVLRPPVVTFMGHVDHGKTSLIDYIRKTNIAAGEAGAITQHIGAFQCVTSVGKITILDTPGHEAFSEMRSRGADVTDIVVLVIAGDEGIKTQTLEAMQQAHEAGVPIVVALNKCDKPNFNAENVYRQLADYNHLPEVWGGQTITVACSATTGKGVPQLLEMLALQAEILELRANPSSRARGSVIESQMHKGFGAVATMLVQNGTLHVGDALVIGEHSARVKTMHDDHGNPLEEAGPSTPVKITGLSGIPIAGSEFIAVKDEREAKELAQKRQEGQKLSLQQSKRKTLESLMQHKTEQLQKKVLPLILKADVQGSLEALRTSLLKIPSSKVELNFIAAGVGEISESDIELAAASKAAIVGFHTQVESHADSMIKHLKVKVITHDIIYHLVDELKALMLTQLDKLSQENDTGRAEVKAVFKASQLGNIAGCMVLDGNIKRGHHIRLIRNQEVIWKGPIASLKRVKEDVKEVSKGFECGILLQGYNDIQVGDILQAFEITYLEQQL